MKKASILAAAAVLLSACSGSPSASDIKNVLESEQQAQVEQARALIGDRADDVNKFAPKITSVDEVECEHAQDNVWDCTFLLSGEIMGSEFRDKPGNAEFRKTDSGWVAL